MKRSPGAAGFSGQSASVASSRLIDAVAASLALAALSLCLVTAFSVKVGMAMPLSGLIAPSAILNLPLRCTATARDGASGFADHRERAESDRRLAKPRSLSFDPRDRKAPAALGQPLLKQGAGKFTADATIRLSLSAQTVVRQRGGMQFDWRAICGPALTAATALLAILVDRYLQSRGVPIPRRCSSASWPSPARSAASPRPRSALRSRSALGAVLPRSPRHRPAMTLPISSGWPCCRSPRAAPPPSPGCCGKDDGSLRARSACTTPPPSGCRPRSIRSISASCCSTPIPARSSSTAPSAIIFRCPTRRPTASRPSSR